MTIRSGDLVLFRLLPLLVWLAVALPVLALLGGCDVSYGPVLSDAYVGARVTLGGAHDLAAQTVAEQGGDD